MSHKHFIGRQHNIGQLTDLLNENSKRLPQSSTDTLKILSIWGKAGVGKTSLLEHVLRLSEKSLKSQLIIRAGKSKFPQSIASIATSDFIRGVPDVSEDLFKETLTARKIIQSLDIRAINRAIKDVPNKAKQAQVRNILIKEVGLLGVRFINKQTEAILRDSPEFNEYANKLIESFQDRNPTRWASLINGLGIKSRNFNLQIDSERELADSLLRDIHSIILGNKPTDTDGMFQSIRNTLNPNKYGKSSLLLIIDDYEALEPLIERFLIHFFLANLESEKFRTLIIVLGRDELSWITDWNKYNYRKVESIGLEVLDESDARSLLHGMDIYDTQIVDNIIEKSQGLPLLLEVLGQAYASGQQSRWIEDYFQRLTYTMTDKQKNWLQALSFLDVRVDEITIQRMLPEENPQEVLNWFKSEASARISANDSWQVDSMVREILRDRVSQDNLQRRIEFEERAKFAKQEYLQLLAKIGK